jgi:hypothetical protein
MSELNVHAFAAMISMLVGMLLAGGVAWLYYSTKIEIVREVLEEYVGENAKLKVAMAAAEMTEDAKEVCKMTLAALNAAFPEK